MASTLVNCSTVVVSFVSPSATGSMFPQAALRQGGGNVSAKPSFLLACTLSGDGDGDGDAAAVGEDVGEGIGDVVAVAGGEGEGDANSPAGLSSSAARTTTSATNATASAMGARRMPRPYIWSTNDGQRAERLDGVVKPARA